MLHTHELWGLNPDALATYLSALGVLRLTAEQKDARVRGFWRNDWFVLVTSLDEDELQEFFLNEYVPSPVLAPWNGGGGFLDTEVNGHADDARNISLIETLLKFAAPRFADVRRAIQQARTLVPRSLTEARAERDLLTTQLRELRTRIKGLAADSAEYHAVTEEFERVEIQRDLARKRVDEVKDEVKATLLQQVASAWSGRARDWFDACVILDESGQPGYAYHLGSGGNEGNQDYTAGFQSNLTLLFRPDGTPTPGASERLRAVLFGGAARVLDRQAAGQFSPGRAGGTNMGVGFEGGARVNPWEFILMIEGAIALVAGLGRRGQADSRARVSSPFWVRAAAAGFGSASEREASPRGEQWLPMWSQPMRYSELVELIREGRAQVGGQQTTRAGDLVRAAARLGLARGIDSLQRFAYLQRNGQSNLAVFTGRFHVRSRSHQALLDGVAPWIERLAWHARQTKDNNVPASLGVVARRTQDALFAVCRREAKPNDWRDLLIAIGEAELALLYWGKNPARRPLPPLSASWIAAVDDATPQGRRALRLALALASQHGSVEMQNGKWVLHDSIRQHFVPLDEPNAPRPRFTLDERGRPARDLEHVCAGRELVADAIALVQRRSIWARTSKKERERTPSLPLLPIRGCEATLEDVGAWIRGDIPDRYLLALARPLLALDWYQIASERPPLPPVPEGMAEPLHLLFRLAHLPFDLPVPSERRMVPITVRVDPEPLRRLAAGDLEGALRVAVRRLEASGLRPVFRRAVSTPGLTRRLAASLAFPVSQSDAARAARLVCKPYAEGDAEQEPGVPA
jgi:CRISPR-associated protein Csx17